MPVHSSYAPIKEPKEDLYELMFERKERDFPDHQGGHIGLGRIVKNKRM